MKRRAIRYLNVRRQLIAAGVAACFLNEGAVALPTGPVVVHGAATFQQSGKLLQVTNSPNAIINWQGFSIGAGEVTRFIQQSAASAVLNRVVGQDPSSILGALQSNGRVFLINPNGIVFGAGAQVDVAGLVASTLNLSNADFLAGRMRFTEVPGAGAVVNEGGISTAPGGAVYLVGAGVTNSGVITTPKGEVVLAAGNSVELVNPGTPNLRVEISAPDNRALNLGSIVADAGRIGIYAGLIHHSGTIRADSAVATEDGRIVLKATKSVTVEATAVTTANGPAGGSVTIQSAETTLVAGTVEAKGTEGQGGTVHVLGNLVGLVEAASIDASGATGGGTVLVGGDFQGKNPDIPNASRTYVAPEAVIKADATHDGDGGRVIVWADEVTRFYGLISARGGGRGGDGGFVEVSGKEVLRFHGAVDVRAPAGRPGTILLDPQDIIVSDTTTTDNNQLNVNVPAAGDPAGSIFFADGGGSNYTISDEALEAQTGNIVLQATRDITVNSGLSGGLDLVNQGAGERVVFQAGRHITIGSPLTTYGAAIILEADSPHSTSGGANGTGQVNIQAAVNSNGGPIILIAGGNSITNNGGFKPFATVNAGAGGINVGISPTATYPSGAPLGIGVNGTLTQILGNHVTTPAFGSISNLITTGALVLGTATTAGTNGLGAGAQTLLANSVTNVYNNSYIKLDTTTPASTFQLVAGSGGITLSQPLTTYQSTIINTTTGPLTINQPLSTSNNNLTINAASLTLGPSGSINTGSGGCNGCPGGTSTIFWDGGGGNLDWFNALNWSGDFLPTSSWDVTIGSGFSTVSINGAATARSLVASSPVQLSGGSLTLANASSFGNAFTLSGGSLLGAGNVTVSGASGALTWSGGTMGSGGTFSLSSGNSGTLSNALTLNRVFDNSGALTLSNAVIGGTGSINNASAGTISTAASTANTINVPLANSGAIQLLSSLTTASFPSNSGTINFAANSPTLSTGGNALTNATTGIIAGTGTLNLGAATLTNQGTLRPGTSPGTLNITGNLAMTSTSVTDIEVRSPWTTAGTDFDVINVTGNATLAGTLNITHFDALTPPNGQQMQIVNAAGGVSGTFGSVNAPFGSSYTALYGATNVNLQFGSVLAVNEWNTDSSGDWNTAGNWSLGVVPTSSHAVRIDRSSASPAVTMGSSTHSILQLFNAETLTLNGSTLSLADASSNTGTINLNSSTLGGTGSLTNQGTINLNGGTISTTFDNLGVVVAANSMSSAIMGAMASNTGTIRVDGSSAGATSLTFAGGFTNTGTLELDSSLGSATLTVSAGTLANNNVIRSLGTNANTINGLVTNPGTIELFNSLAISNFPANAGIINLTANDPTLSTGGNFTNTTTGLIRGSGTLDLGGATLTNNGTMQPGATPGTLNITGNLTLGSSSVIDIELGGLAQGAQYDFINVTGSATLGGTMNVNEVNGFKTSPGDSFQVIACGAACGGTFTAVNAPADVTLTPAYNVTNFTLGTTAVVNRWAGMSGGWDVAGNWSRGVPGANDDVVIDVPGTTETITVSTGAQAAKTLTIQENLTISGGSLALGSAPADASTINGTLTLSGGTLQGAGNVTVGGAFSWSGGTVTGSGQLITNGTSTLSGAADKTLLNRTWTNAGVVDLTGGRLDLSGSTGVFTNQAAGVFNVASTSGSIISGGAGNAFNNQGTFNKNAAGTGAIDGALSFSNTGTVNVNAGTLRLDAGGTDSGSYSVGAGNSLRFNGGTRNLNAGSNVTGAGNVDFSGGTTNVVGSFGIAGATAISGGTASFNGGPYSFGNTVTVSGGTLGGSATLTNLGTFNVSNGTVGASFVNQGAFNVTGGTGYLSGATFDLNGGALDVAGGAMLTKTGGAFNWNGGTLSGSGNLTATGGAGFNITGSAARTLNGLTLSLGNLSLSGGSLALQSGTINAAGTATIVNGATLFAQGGTLAGAIIDVSGVFEAAGGVVSANTLNLLTGGLLRGGGTVNANINNLAGTVAAGTSPGVLTINGSYVQGPAGSFAVEIGGMTPGTQYDRLVVSGNATLDGTLDVALINSFAPKSGDTFTVIQSGGTVSGSFATTNYPPASGLMTQYLPSSVNVAVPLPPSVQSVVAASEKSTTSDATTGEKEPQESRREIQKKPICTGGYTGTPAAAAAAVRPVMIGVGGRCTAYGCF